MYNVSAFGVVNHVVINYPSTLPYDVQVDIPSDVQQKCVRLCQRYINGKDISANLFDEAQYCVFKELLPYWAGFVRSYKPPEEGKKIPSKPPVLYVQYYCFLF